MQLQKYQKNLKVKHKMLENKTDLCYLKYP